MVDGEFEACFHDQERETVNSFCPKRGKPHPLKRILDDTGSTFKARLNLAARSGTNSDANFQNLLATLKSRMMDPENPDDAAAALAELRVYGDLRAAGFEVKRIPEAPDKKTPDYHCRVRQNGSAQNWIEVEVASKQESPDARELEVAFRTRSPHPDISESKEDIGTHCITTRVACIQPAGSPDPTKTPLGSPQTESVQTNLISKVCAIKQSEGQFSGICPAILWVDFFDFGSWPDILKVDQTHHLLSGTNGLTSGALWNAVYGEKGDPIFEDTQMGCPPLYELGHPGRFSINNTSKLSAVIFSVSDGVIVFENPNMVHPLPKEARWKLHQLPNVDLSASYIELYSGAVEARVSACRNEAKACLEYHKSLGR